MLWQDELTADHAQRKESLLWRQRHELTSPQSVEVERDGRQFINFSSNDYLGLASHPLLAQASAEAAHSWGTGSGASHIVSGHQSPHHQLEQELAEFLGTEDALLFSTGYMANLAIPRTFLGRNDLLLQDKLNHASLIDAAALCRAEFKRYPHLDLQSARTILDSSAAKRKMLSTDSVFSMDGDIAPLADLIELCESTDTLLVVDDAHGIGVLGKTGAGWLEHFDVQQKNKILTIGTLGKAFGSFGAFVAGSGLYIDQLKQHARTYIYTTALPPTVVEATRAALTIVREADDRRKHLRDLIRHFRAEMTALGMQLMDSTTAIQPILLGSESAALDLSKHLENQGIWVPAIRPPTVPKGSSRLRVCLSSNHSINHINQLVKSIYEYDFEVKNV